MGVFTKETGKQELRLAACLPAPKLSSLADKIKQVQENCGWSLRLTNNIKEIDKPTPDELRLLRWLV